MSNITQVMENERNMATMNRAVAASGLDQVLSSTGPYTVFVPSDLAFGKLERGVMEQLLKPYSKAKLAGLLNHHIVDGQISYKDLKDGDKLQSLDGSNLIVRVIGDRVSINGGVVQNRDVEASNGVLHSLDTVLQN